VLKIASGLFLILFAAVHGGFEPKPGGLSYWSARYGDSWLLGSGNSELVRAVGGILWVGATFAMVAAGAAILGIVVPRGWWRVLTIGSTVASLLLFTIFLHPNQWIAALVDAAILAVVLFSDWSPVPTAA
jgi:hypothetical protein